MRIADSGSAVTLWASARDTDDWARKPGAAWPCSTLAGHRFCATFDTNGLLDLTIDGRWPGEAAHGDDVDGNELSAICADLLSEQIAKDHPVYFVAIGQFRAGN